MQDDPLNNFEWKHGEKTRVLRTYAGLVRGRLFGHWLWAAVMRVAAGESVEEVLNDYGWYKEPPKRGAGSIVLKELDRDQL